MTHIAQIEVEVKARWSDESASWIIMAEFPQADDNPVANFQAGSLEDIEQELVDFVTDLIEMGDIRLAHQQSMPPLHVMASSEKLVDHV